jgi:hypothetical protein
MSFCFFVYLCILFFTVRTRVATVQESATAAAVQSDDSAVLVDSLELDSSVSPRVASVASSFTSKSSTSSSDKNHKKGLASGKSETKHHKPVEFLTTPTRSPPVITKNTFPEDSRLVSEALRNNSSPNGAYPSQQSNSNQGIVQKHVVYPLHRNAVNTNSLPVSPTNEKAVQVGKSGQQHLSHKKHLVSPQPQNTANSSSPAVSPTDPKSLQKHSNQPSVPNGKHKVSPQPQNTANTSSPPISSTDPKSLQKHSNQPSVPNGKHKVSPQPQNTANTSSPPISSTDQKSLQKHSNQPSVPNGKHKVSPQPQNNVMSSTTSVNPKSFVNPNTQGNKSPQNFKNNQVPILKKDSVLLQNQNQNQNQALSPHSPDSSVKKESQSNQMKFGSSSQQSPDHHGTSGKKSRFSLSLDILKRGPPKDGDQLKSHYVETNKTAPALPKEDRAPQKSSLGTSVASISPVKKDSVLVQKQNQNQALSPHSPDSSVKKESQSNQTKFGSSSQQSPDHHGTSGKKSRFSLSLDILKRGPPKDGDQLKGHYVETNKTAPALPKEDRAPQKSSLGTSVESVSPEKQHAGKKEKKMPVTSTTSPVDVKLDTLKDNSSTTNVPTFSASSSAAAPAPAEIGAALLALQDMAIIDTSESKPEAMKKKRSTKKLRIENDSAVSATQDAIRDPINEASTDSPSKLPSGPVKKKRSSRKSVSPEVQLPSETTMSLSTTDTSPTVSVTQDAVRDPANAASIDSTSMQPSEPGKKKRSSRKSFSPEVQLPSDTTDSVASTGISTSSDEAVAVKRKRGRPKKNTVVNNVDVADNETGVSST